MDSKTKEDYAQYRLEKAERCIKTAELDLSEFFGSVKISVDGLDAQRRLRDEWR